MPDTVQTSTPKRLPLLLDTEAFEFGECAVLDSHYNVVRVCETVEEAEVFIAEANGSDVETVRRDTEKRARMLSEYRNKLRRELKPE